MSIGPQIIQVYDFAEARGPELAHLHKVAHHPQLRTAQDSKLFQQKNQRRRRANAFNSYQIPQRVRLQKARTKDPNSKTTSVQYRKNRRRPRILLQKHTYTTLNEGTDDANSSYIMLPTHIWHAKRMKMIEIWDHKLAKCRMDKSISAALAAARKSALLHDMSYMCTLELHGARQYIWEAFNCISDPDIASRLSQDSGHDEQDLDLYGFQSFPNGFIAPSSLMWSSEKAEKQQLWVWIHPAAYKQVTEAIVQACDAIALEDPADTERRIEICDRRGEFARFKLRGRTASSILASLCTSRIACEPEWHCQDEECTVPVDNESHATAEFLGGVLRKKPANKVNKDPLSASVMAPSKVHSVSICDPRYIVPLTSAEPFSLLQEPSEDAVPNDTIHCPLTNADISVKDSCELEADNEILLQNIQKLLAHELWSCEPLVSATKCSPKKELMNVPYSSPLWSGERRNCLTHHSFRKNNVLNQETLMWRQRKGKKIAPVKIPLLLVEKRNETFPCMSGWDLVMLPVYATTLLHALSSLGAMVIGLEEEHAFSTAINRPSFPADYIDSEIGQAYWKECASEALSQHQKKPKAKRSSAFLGKKAPELQFQPNWNALLPVESTTDEWIVIRNRAYMQSLNFGNPEVTAFVALAMPMLVAITINVPRRGTLQLNMMLLSPLEHEHEAFYRDRKWNGTQKTAQQQPARESLGYITSAIYDRPKGAFRAIGLCACEPLQRLKIKDGHYLAMACANSSRIYRPVCFSILP